VLAFTASAGDRHQRIGRSVRDRVIRAAVIGDRSSENVGLMVACIHGDECAGKAIVRALWDMAPLEDVQIWVIKDLNPDGSRAGTRQNARGVDLNRNFPYNWEGYGEPWDRYYPGPRAASEPETRAAKRFIADLRPDVGVWYHQPLEMVIRSRGDLSIMRSYARKVGLPLKEYRKLPGTAVAWENHRFPNKTAFVVELPGGALSKRAARRHARALVEVVRSS
jgi:protein MpaA